MATGAAITNYLESAILNHFLRGGVAVAQPTSLTVGLFTDTAGTATDEPITEVSGGAYARATATFGAAASGSISNNADITFAVATAAWGTINYVVVFDNTGNKLFWGALTSSKVIATGDTFKILSGSLTVTLD